MGHLIQTFPGTFIERVQRILDRVELVAVDRLERFHQIAGILLRSKIKSRIIHQLLEIGALVKLYIVMLESLVLGPLIGRLDVLRGSRNIKGLVAEVEVGRVARPVI